MHALAQSLPWGVDRVDAEVAHADGEPGNDADGAIVDTGIDSNHPDLQANLGRGHAVVSCGPTVGGGRPCHVAGTGNACNQPWDDDNDHGSHVAGVADADDVPRVVIGVSTAATLHAITVLDCSGGGSFSDVARGIEIVAAPGLDSSDST